MKKILSLILIFIFFITCCSCKKAENNDTNSEISTNQKKIDTSYQDEITETINPAPVTTPTKNGNKTNSKTSNLQVNNSSSDQKEDTETKSVLPNVKYSLNDSNVKFTDITNLPDGSFAVSGHRYTEDSINSIIQIFDKNSVFQKECLFKNGNGFDKISACSDGGFIAASYCPPCITKVNSDFEIEWFMPYENIEFEGTLQDIEEISPNLIAVLFVSLNSPNFERRLKLSFLNKNGNLIETIDLMKNNDPQDADIIPDGQGGFYLLTSCNESLANKYTLVAENYNNSKATEVAVMHYSSNRQVTSVKTFGGCGNDWIEEATIDSNGNIYLAVGTDWNGADSFWEMSVNRSMPFRRMLVKLDKNGNIIYKVPLANQGMAVDQVFGIHIKDGVAYVVGMSDYFDSYQVKYPCEQISPSEKGNRVFCVYTALIDTNGKEINRNIFRCDINNAACDSTMLPSGTLIIAGSLSAYENPFNITFPSDIDTFASLFLF